MKYVRRKDWSMRLCAEGWQFWPPGYDADFVLLKKQLTRPQALAVLEVIRAVYTRGDHDRTDKILKAIGLYGARRTLRP